MKKQYCRLVLEYASEYRSLLPKKSPLLKDYKFDYNLLYSKEDLVPCSSLY